MGAPHRMVSALMGAPRGMGGGLAGNDGGAVRDPGGSRADGLVARVWGGVGLFCLGHLLPLDLPAGRGFGLLAFAHCFGHCLLF